MRKLHTNSNVCFSQGHKYVLQAELLYKSWDLDDSQLVFVKMLKDLEKNEMRGKYLTVTNVTASSQLHLDE